MKREDMPFPTPTNVNELHRREETYRIFWILTRKWRVSSRNSEGYVYYAIYTDTGAQDFCVISTLSMPKDEQIARHIVDAHNASLKEEYDVTPP